MLYTPLPNLSLISKAEIISRRNDFGINSLVAEKKTLKQASIYFTCLSDITRKNIGCYFKKFRTARNSV